MVAITIDRRPLRGPGGADGYGCYRQETPPGSGGELMVAITIDRRPLRGSGPGLMVADAIDRGNRICFN